MTEWNSLYNNKGPNNNNEKLPYFHWVTGYLMFCLIGWNMFKSLKKKMSLALRTLPKHLSQEMFFKVEDRKRGLESLPENPSDHIMEQEHMNQCSILKNTQELSASVKSIQTNFIVILLGITASFFIKNLSLDYQSVFNLASNSVQKTLLPIATTLVNFSIVRTVGFKFWLLVTDK